MIPGADFGTCIGAKSVAASEVGDASVYSMTHLPVFKEDKEGLTVESVCSRCEHNAESTVTGNGIVSCEIEVAAVETTVVNIDSKPICAIASEVGVLAHLVSESVVVESLESDALTCGVALTVCCP